MSVFSMHVGDTNKLFLEYIKPGLIKEIYKNTTLYDRFKKSSEQMRGEFGVMKLLTSTPKSARPSSTTSLPTPKQGVYNEFIVYMKRGMYATLQFDGLAIACGKGKGAVMDIVKTEIDGIMFYISHKLNKQYWGDGSGRLAQLDASSTNSTTVNIDSPIFGQDSNHYTFAHQYLFEGMSVDIYDEDDNLEAEEVSISIGGISDDEDGTSELTMDTAVTASDGSWIFDHDTYATSEKAGTGVPMGLYGIMSTANATVGTTATSYFQNINRSSNTFAQAQAFTMGSVPLTSKKMLEVIQKIERYGMTDVILTNDIIWRNWYAILEADKTMPNEPAYWGGTTGLSFYGGKSKRIPVIYDEDCPDNWMGFIDDSKIKIVQPDGGGLTWVKGDSGSVLTRVQGADEYTAHLIEYYNMSTNLPRALGFLEDIKHAES